MKDEKKWTFGKILALAVCILLAVKFIFDFSGFWNLFSSIGGTVVSVLSYILVGFVIAYVLDAYIQFMSNKVLKFWKSKPKAKRLVCIVIGYATFAGVLAFFVFTLVPYLKDSVKTLYNELPGLIEHSKTLYSKLLDGTLISLPDAAINSIANALENVFDTVIAYIDAAKISGFLTTTIVMIFNVVMGIMVSVYMLIEKEDILKASNKIVDGLFNKKNALRIKWAGRKINEIFRRYFTGKILQAIIVSILAAVVFSIGRIPYALLFCRCRRCIQYDSVYRSLGRRGACYYYKSCE